MKAKIMAILMLVVFLVGIFPATIAREDGKGNEIGVNQRVRITNEEKLKPKTQLVLQKAENANQKARINFQQAEKRFQQAKERLKKEKVKFQQAEERFQQAKKRFQQTKERREAAREGFIQAKKRLKECQGYETEECQQLRNEIKVKSKNFLGNSADAIIQHLEKIKSKIESNEYMSEEEKTELIADLDEKIAEILDAKESIETSETKEEIIEAAKTINAAWKKIRNHARYWAERTVNAKMEGILVKIERLLGRLENTLDRMEENGKDISVAEPLVEEFKALVESAKDNYEIAKENYLKFKETKDQADLDAGKEAMSQARENLIAAHKKIKEIVRAIKDANGTEELSEASEDTSEEETVEETEQE